MSQPLTKKTTDHSSENRFSFSFFCDRCGKEWISQPVPFRAEKQTVIEHTVTKERLWADEHRTAFAEANLEAHFHFNNCPRCGKWICDDCFTEDTSKQGGLCKDCSTSRDCSHKEEQKEIQEP